MSTRRHGAHHAGGGLASAIVLRVRRFLDRQRTRRARAHRERLRQRALREAATGRQHQYDELRAVAREIERADPFAAQCFELQELLDYFVRLTVGHQRCVVSLRISDGVGFDAAAPHHPRAIAEHRLGIAARRLRQRAECTIWLERIADQIDSADELIRLLAQRVTCANLAPLIDREIEQRLTELDEVDAAMGLLSA